MAKKAKKTNKTRNDTSLFSEIVGIIILLFTVVLLLSLISYDVRDWPNSSRPPEEGINNYLGKLGAYLSWIFLDFFGYMSYGFVLLFALWGWSVLRKKPLKKNISPTIFISCFSFWIATFSMLLSEHFKTEKEAASIGGSFGLFALGGLEQYVGKWGAYLIPFGIMVLVTVLTTPLSVRKITPFMEKFVLGVIHWIGGILKSIFYGIFEILFNRSKNVERDEPDITMPEPGRSSLKTATFEMETSVIESEEIYPEIGIIGSGRTAVEKPEGEDTGEQIIISEKSEKEVPYQLPPVSLLNESDEFQQSETEEELKEQAKILRENLRHFGVNATVVRISPGPVITRYELKPAPGVKVSRIANLADDLALVLRAKSIRILSPIPGEGVLGIEVPNKKSQLVYVKEIIESDKFRNSQSFLEAAIGKTTSGEPFTTDLKAMPHLLIAGSTGSGKSVCLNSLIISLLFRAEPNEVQFIMVDPKMIELSLYQGIPHLLAPVITDPRKAADSLKWAVSEMDRRYKFLAGFNVRNIEQYNEKIGEILADGEDIIVEEDEIQHEKPEFLTYIVIIIDELADLMIVSANEIEESLMRLAQMARAVGIHLVLATQRPSVDVITGVIKSNFPARIAFHVPSKTDSRTILDLNGAEKLLGRGDMLFLPPGTAEPIRLHGAFISTEEIERVTRFIRNISKSEPEDKLGITDETRKSNIGQTGPNGERDELFEQALRLVVRHQQGSVSLVQRRLKVGYARAGRIIDELEEAGIVGAFDGSKAREVLVPEDFLEKLDRGEVSV